MSEVKKMSSWVSSLFAGVVLAGLAGHAAAADISGAGATFPYPVYAKWAEAYKAATGVGLNYQSIGSGGGIKQIKAATVTFGASDKPLEPRELAAAGLVQFPMVIGGVVPVVNVPGIRPGELVLDGPTLAGIYVGDIASWDDAHPGAQPAGPAAEARDRAHLPLGRVGHELPVHQLPGDGQRPVQGKDRRGDLGRMAGRHRRQGQRGRGPT
ncbi:MAG: substrate-binding domain-containing protein [Steroidobacteraceae bacterium]